MNCLIKIIFLASISAIALGAGYLPEPTNIKADVSSTGVALSWDAVEGANGYMLTLSDGQTAVAPSTHGSFGGLLPSTSYTVDVVATDVNNTRSSPGTVSFRTLMARVEGLEVRVATTTSLDIMWKPVNNTLRYSVRVTTEKGEDVAADIAMSDNSALITGLQSTTFYYIYVHAVGSDSVGEASMIRARTDGSGVKIVAFWEGDSKVIGGEAMIYRPIKIPAGVYRTSVRLPCAVETARFWNAKLDKDMSRPADGYYVLMQRKTWMLRKTEIGMNFFVGNSTCNFTGSAISALFGDDVLNRVDESTSIAFPFEISEWWNRTGPSNGQPPYAAGWIKFETEKIFHGANWGDATSNKTIQKPPPRTFAFALDTSPSCFSGLIIRQVWGMAYKNTTTLPGNSPFMHYFTQNEALWPNAIPGFLYSYNPETCESRTGFKLSALIGGSQVTAINEEPDAMLKAGY